MYPTPFEDLTPRRPTTTVSTYLAFFVSRSFDKRLSMLSVVSTNPLEGFQHDD